MYISLEKNVVAKYNLFVLHFVEIYNSKSRRKDTYKLVPFISQEVPIFFSSPPVLITITMFTPKGL